MHVMFKNNKIDLTMINPSSKMSLKMSCINACRGDVGKAKELYEFLSEGVDSMPDFDIQEPSALEQAKNAIGSVFGWVKENRDDIVQAVGWVQSLRSGGSSVPTPTPPQASIPPIPEP